MIDAEAAQGIPVVAEYCVVTLNDHTVAEAMAAINESHTGLTNARVTEHTNLPAGDKLFRHAWDDSNPEDFVGINMTKAIEITHMKRRAKRAAAFAPYDDIIAKNIPGQDATAAEAARQSIRDADAIVQTNIDACVDEAGLRAIITAEGL